MSDRLRRASLIGGLLALAVIGTAQAASPTKGEELKREMDGWGSLGFDRLTSEGAFKGCELTFGTTFRDFRARGGELVLVHGSIASDYVRGKTFNILLKVKTAEIQVNTSNRREKYFQPTYADLSFGRSLGQFRKIQFDCEGGGICIAYGDRPDLSLMTQVFKEFDEPGPTITVTTSKGGIDKRVALRQLIAGDASNAVAYKQFYDCLSEILKNMARDIKGK